MGKRLWGRIQKHLTLIKGLFIFSILIFVIQMVGRVAREVNGEQLRAELATLDTGTFLLLLVGGFVAVLPMLVYDFTIVEFLPGSFRGAT